MLNETTEDKKATLDVIATRSDFPILNQKVYGHPLIYLDNAATSQKPRQVIDVISTYYKTYNANIHRGVHYLSQKASQAYDDTRVKVQEFINAASEKEIVFVRGTTEGINLVASSYGRKNISTGDEIIISAMEHHSNIVPWQILCEEKGAVLRVIPINDKGELIFSEFEKLLNDKTKLISLVYVSNSLGTINPVKEIIAHAHTFNIPVMLDGAQGVAHFPVDVQDLDCDFFAFSGHKMLGPTGIGVLYGKLNLLENMPPYMGGGDMISSVSFEKTTYNEVPSKFEAGTPHVEGVIGLGAAIDYWNSLNRTEISAYEKALLIYATEKLATIGGLKFIGTAKEKTGVCAFVIDNLNALDVGMYLDTLGIAVRTGHHCTEPVMKRLGIRNTPRISFVLHYFFEGVDVL